MIKKTCWFFLLCKKDFLDEKPDAYFIAEVYLFMMLGGLPTKTNWEELLRVFVFSP